MKNKLFFLSFCIVVTIHGVFSQDSSAGRKMFSFGKDKIHIHSDKDTYLPGETIWFKVYLTQTYLPDTATTNFFVDLIDQNGELTDHKVLPVFDGTCAGSLEIGKSTAARFLLLKAYRKQDQQNDTDNIYIKKLLILQNDSTPVTRTEASIVSACLRLFPEGGSFVNGSVNKVAFKAVTSDGQPYGIVGVVKNNRDEVIDSARSLHDGMGIFSVTPLPTERYYVEWTDNKGKKVRTDLPQSTDDNIALHVEQVNNYVYYTIQNPAHEHSLEKISIVASLHNKDIYRATVDMKNTPIASGRIPIQDLPTGIMQVTAFADSTEPIAERIFFIDNINYAGKATIQLKETDLAHRGKNVLEIEVNDTTLSNFSIAIHDAVFKNEETANILTDLLLGPDIAGNVYHPNWYTSPEIPVTVRRKAIDLVMLTNGWRKYKRESKDYQVTKNENYISLAGVATNNKGVPLAGQPVILLVTTKTDSSKSFFNLVTDSAGRFIKDGLLFYDTAVIRYQAIAADKKSSPVTVSISSSFVKAANTIQPINIIKSNTNFSSVADPVLTMIWRNQNLLDGFTAKGFRLNNVTVTNRKWRNDPIMLMDEKYSTGLYRGGSNTFKFDVMNDPMTKTKGDVMNYILGKVPGLSLEYPRNGRTGGFKRILFGRVPLELIYIDERPVRFDPADGMGQVEIQNLNIDDIAYIKFYPKHPLEVNKPALMIYLKKGDEISEAKASLLPKLSVPGYSVIKEFYSPDYAETAQKNNNIPDLRTTLYWQPNMLFDKDQRKATVTFYNNDVSSKLEVVLEGIDAMGKVYHQTILPSRK